LADRRRKSNVVLDRDEWKAFLEDVRKLIQEHEKMLAKIGEERTDSSGWGESGRFIGGRTPLMSRILSFLGAKPKLAPARYCPYCSVELEPADKFCRICGKNIQVQVEPDARQTTQKDSSIDDTSTQSNKP
jgi:hypothetical protein